MRWERWMIWLSATSVVVHLVAAAGAWMGQGEPVQYLYRVAGFLMAWLGWLSALRWREAAETSAASVKLNYGETTRVRQWDEGAQ